jgi:hypothetical protein
MLSPCVSEPARKISRCHRDIFPILPLVSRKRRRHFGSAVSDTPTKKVPRDAIRVNMHEAWEIAYWCKRISCTRAQLIIAVHSVGPMVGDVRQFLGTAKGSNEQVKH